MWSHYREHHFDVTSELACYVMTASSLIREALTLGLFLASVIYSSWGQKFWKRSKEVSTYLLHEILVCWFWVGYCLSNIYLTTVIDTEASANSQSCSGCLNKAINSAHKTWLQVGKFVGSPNIDLFLAPMDSTSMDLCCSGLLHLCIWINAQTVCSTYHHGQSTVFGTVRRWPHHRHVVHCIRIPAKWSIQKLQLTHHLALVA